MGVLKSTFNFLAYPILRPIKQSKDSFNIIKNDLDELKTQRKIRLEKSIEEKKAYIESTKEEDFEGYKPTQEELDNPLLIKCDYKRFDVLYKMNKWDDAELDRQWIAVKLTKRFSAYSSIILLLVGLISMFFSPVWIVLLLGPIILIGSAVSFASSVKYAIYQMQLENRKLINYKEFMAHDNMLNYIFKK